MKPWTRITGMPLQDTAVGFYRIQQPLRFFKREGLTEDARSLPFAGDFSMQSISLGKDAKKLQWHDRLLMENAKDSVAILSTIVWHDEDFTRMLDLRKWSGAKLIIDIDDNFLAVSRDNPGHAGVTRVLPKIQRCLAFADGLTVSVPMLKQLYAPLNDNIFVNPNGLDFSWWDQYRVKKHTGIRIGWRGAGGHKDDLELIAPALRKVKEAYPEVTIVLFSNYKPDLGFAYEKREWVDFANYPEALAKCNLDIAVVPLVDSSYNRCKSNLNYLEHAALSVPCVLSPVENQRNLPALYASTNYEWFDALARLIENRTLRHDLGSQANQYIRDHFDMKQLIHPLASWIDALPRRTDIEPENFLDENLSGTQSRSAATS